jgi:peptidyl-Lys metalloendopeptidase
VEPTEADYVKLAPGQSVSGTVRVSDAYDLSQSGTYSIGYDLGDHAERAGVSAFKSNELSLFIEGRLSELQKPQEGTVHAESLSYTSCTSTRQTSIASAVSSAGTYATNAYNYLNTTTPGNTARYKTWFGSYTSTNWSTAKSHYNAIKNAFATAAINVDCTCTDTGTYAYVYPTQPYKIYVCGAFWSAPATGTDSKAGTLVHEMSHFNVVASTDDWAYGQSAAKSLAISNPTKALDNADNHEYFAENNPAQN